MASIIQKNVIIHNGYSSFLLVNKRKEMEQIDRQATVEYSELGSSALSLPVNLITSNSNIPINGNGGEQNNSHLITEVIMNLHLQINRVICTHFYGDSNGLFTQNIPCLSSMRGAQICRNPSKPFLPQPQARK